MATLRGIKVELDDGSEIVVPGFPYCELRQHLRDAQALDKDAAEEFWVGRLVDLVRRNHPDFTREVLEANAGPTIWAVRDAAMRTSNEKTVPGEAKRRSS